MKYLVLKWQTKMCFRGVGCKCGVMVVNASDRGFTTTNMVSVSGVLRGNGLPHERNAKLKVYTYVYLYVRKYWCNYICSYANTDVTRYLVCLTLHVVKM